MKILIVRHAEPNYAIDGLTRKGQREAELLSERLSKLDVKAFYVSPRGRARETAEYTLKKMGRTAEVLPWLAEFRGHRLDPETKQELLCWDYKPREWRDDRQLYDKDTWVDSPFFEGGNAKEIWEETKVGLDEVLSRHGYTRDWPIYRCENNQSDTLVFFCHFGIGAAMMGHLCGFSPMALWHGTCMQPSSVTTIITEERVKGEVAFRCMSMGDLSHLYAAGERYSTAALFPECYTGRDSTNPPEWDELIRQGKL